MPALPCRERALRVGPVGVFRQEIVTLLQANHIVREAVGCLLTLWSSDCKQRTARSSGFHAWEWSDCRLSGLSSRKRGVQSTNIDSAVGGKMEEEWPRQARLERIRFSRTCLRMGMLW